MGSLMEKAHGEGISLSFIAWWNCVTLHWSNTNYSAGLCGFTSWSRCVCAASEWLWVSVQFQDILSPGKKKEERSWERMKHHLVFSKESRVRHSQPCLRKTLEQVAFFGRRLRPRSSNNRGRKVSQRHFFVICSASPCLLLRGVQFYLGKSKAG